MPRIPAEIASKSVKKKVALPQKKDGGGTLYLKRISVELKTRQNYLFNTRSFVVT